MRTIVSLRLDGRGGHWWTYGDLGLLYLLPDTFTRFYPARPYGFGVGFARLGWPE